MNLKRLIPMLPLLGLSLIPISCSWQPHGQQAEQTRARALDLVEQGQAFESKGQYQTAIQRYLQARDLHETPQVDYRLGHSYAQINDLTTAQQYLKKAVESGPDNSAAFFELVHVEEQLKENVPSSAPVAPPARPAAPNAVVAQPAVPAAVAVQPVAANSEKGSVRISDAYRVLFGKQGSAPARSVPTREAGPTFLADASFHATKGREYLKNDKPDLAIDEFKDALALNPADGASRVLLAQAYTKLGDKTEAQKQLMAALRNNPSDSGALEALAGMDLPGGSNSVQTQELLENMSASGTSDADTQIALGDLYVKMDRQQSASDAYQKAHQLKPNDPRPLWKLGNIRRDADDLSGARQYYQESLKKDPRFIPALNNLAFLADQSGEYNEARGYLEQIIKIDPTWSKAYFNLGVLYEERLNDPAKAIEYYNQYLKYGGPNEEKARASIAALRAK